jgi:hypothetical protein
MLPEGDFHREIGICLLRTSSGDRLIDIAIGSACSVEFDFLRIWEYTKTLYSGAVRNLEFWHIHPDNSLYFSETDINCCKGLNAAFGVPIEFGVMSFVDGRLCWTIAYWDDIRMIEIDSGDDGVLFDDNLAEMMIQLSRYRGDL